MQILSPKHKTVPSLSHQPPVLPQVHNAATLLPEKHTRGGGGGESASQREHHVTGQEGQEGPAQGPE